MLLAVFLAAVVPAFFVTWLLLEEPAPILLGFFAGLAAVVLWVRRYEGEWTWGD
jgi:hypothetical protein